jgi:Arylsulfotransferase (ASST)
MRDQFSVELLFCILPILLLSCDNDSDNKNPRVTATGAKVYSEMNLACEIDFNSDSIGSGVVEFGLANSFDKTWKIGGVSNGKNSALIMGMYADTTYDIRVVVSNGGQSGTSNTVSCTTGSLPSNLPVYEITRNEVTPEDSGFYFFPAFHAGSSGMYSYVLGVDSNGGVIFHHYVHNGLAFVVVTGEDRSIYLSVESPLGNYIEVLNQCGGQTAVYDPRDMDCDNFHHEIQLTPEGNILTFDIEVHEIDFPNTSHPDAPTETNYLAADRIIEFTPAGEFVWTWNTWDHFDFYDPQYGGEAYDSLDTIFWTTHFALPDPSFDWTHANAILPDYENNTLLVSLHHFSMLANIDRATGEVLWEMGPFHGDFTLESGEWFIRQHSPEILPNGNLLIFDNGYSFAVRNDLPTVFDFERPYSRAVEYEIDLEARTLNQVWEFRETPDFYSDAMGDVDLLPSGNVLVTSSQEGNFWEGTNLGRLMLVTHDSEAKKLWELKTEQGWSVYRAEWFATLQPE